MSETEQNKVKDFSMRYWDYYCALESDCKHISRFIEFSDHNLKTNSIELTRLLLSSCSEIDVLFKEICSELADDRKAENINDYQEIIKEKLPELINEKVNIGFNFTEIQPFAAWNEDTTPNWWRMHNKVKHERSKYYKEANLDNALNAVSALFLTVNYYYKIILEEKINESLTREFTFKDLTMILKSDSNFIRFMADYYVQHLRVN